MGTVKMYWVPDLKPVLRENHGTESLREVEQRFSSLLAQGLDPFTPVSLHRVAPLSALHQAVAEILADVSC